MNRDRHLPTVSCDTPSFVATALLSKSSPHARMIFDRNANACDDSASLAHRVN